MASGKINYQESIRDGYCYIEMTNAAPANNKQEQVNRKVVDSSQSTLHPRLKEERVTRGLQLNQGKLSPQAAKVEAITAIGSILSNDMAAEELVLCYQQLVNLLFRCRSITVTRDDTLQWSTMQIDPNVASMMRKLVFKIVVQRIKEEKVLFDNNTRIAGKSHTRRGKAYKEEDCLIAGYKFLIDELFSNFTDAKNDIDREVKGLLRCLKTSESSTQGVNYHRHNLMHKMFEPSNPYFTYLHRQKQMIDQQFDRLELYLVLLHLHPMNHGEQSPDFTTIPETGKVITLADESKAMAHSQVLEPKLPLLKTLGRDHKGLVSLCHNHCYRLPTSTQYHGIMVVRDLEKQHVVIVPFDKHSVAMKEKADTLLAAYYDKPVQVLYFSFEHEWFKPFTELMQAFTAASCSVMTPFRVPKGEGYSNKCQAQTLSVECYLLNTEQLPSAVTGEVEFRFYPNDQQCCVMLKAPKTHHITQQIQTGFPYQDMSTKQPNAGLLVAAYQFLKLFNDKMCCTISQRNAAELVQPCMDRYGFVYETNELMTWLLKSKVHPVITSEKLKKKDVFSVSILNHLINCCGSLNSFFQFEDLETPEVTSRPVLPKPPVATGHIKQNKQPVTVERLSQEIEELVRRPAPLAELVKKYDEITTSILTQAQRTIPQRNSAHQIMKFNIHPRLIISMRVLTFTIIRLRCQALQHLPREKAKVQAYRYLVDALVFPTFESTEESEKVNKESQRLMEKILLGGNSSTTQYPQSYRREQVAENIVPSSCRYIAYTDIYRSKVTPTLDRLELYLFFADCHPLCHSMNNPDVSDISPNGRTIGVQGFTNVPQTMLAWQSKTELLQLDVSSNAINTLISHHQKYQLSISDDTQGVLVIKDLEHHQFVVLPINKNEPDIYKKISSIFTGFTTKQVDLLYFSCAKEQPEILSDLFDSFPLKTKAHVITPFRQLDKATKFAPSKDGIWKSKHFLLAQEQLPETVGGRIRFQFHPDSEQFKLELLAAEHDAVLSQQFFMFPVTQATDKVASFQLLVHALCFFKQFSNTVHCPITGAASCELNEPCMDKSGYVYEKSALIKCVQMYGKNPVTQSPMTESDIIVAPRFNELIRECAAIEKRYQLNNEDVLQWLDAQTDASVAGKMLSKLLKTNLSQQAKLQHEFEQLTHAKRQEMSVVLPPVKDSSSDSDSEPDDIAEIKRGMRYAHEVNQPSAVVSSDSEPDDIELEKLRARQADQDNVYSSGVDSD